MVMEFPENRLRTPVSCLSLVVIPESAAAEDEALCCKCALHL